MSIALFQRLKALEARVLELEKKVAEPQVSPKTQVEGNGATNPPSAASKRAMCHKCGVKPNHYFHVKNCQGQKNNNGDDGIGTPGTT